MGTNYTENGFTGDYCFLSNMFPSLCIYDGLEFPSSEHLYQWLKIPDKARWWREVIRKAPHGKIAKKLANSEKCPRRQMTTTEWKQFRIDCMKKALKAKFDNNTELRCKLLSTGDLELVEVNYWGDSFWGTYKGVGENYLGILLMILRDKYRQEENKNES